MNQDNSLLRKIFKVISYILVAMFASFVTYFFMPVGYSEKLAEIAYLIDEYYIGQATEEQLTDGAAAGMVAATGDRWSYYIPASEFAAHMEQMNNAYVGIGVTITMPEDVPGFQVVQVDETGGASEAGILAGDVITEVEGQKVTEIGETAASALIRGEENTNVTVKVLRDGEELEFSVVRKMILVTVAEGKMLQDNIGLVTITNFDERCAQETLAEIEQLLEQGATALIFDVRFNPGGYKHELVKVLDYLLPEGNIFHSVDYAGEEELSQSDESCLEMPMAVLINDASYSAAEFFAAALSEYNWATVVGEPTTGKGYFQNTFSLSDGSAVGLSVGKYYTPKGVSLAEVGGLQPDVLTQVDEDTYMKLYAGNVPVEEDPQLQAAIAVLQAE